jgi:hypothetical protein
MPLDHRFSYLTSYSYLLAVNNLNIFFYHEARPLRSGAILLRVCKGNVLSGEQGFEGPRRKFKRGRLDAAEHRIWRIEMALRTMRCTETQRSTFCFDRRSNCSSEITTPSEILGESWCLGVAVSHKLRSTSSRSHGFTGRAITARFFAAKTVMEPFTSWSRFTISVSRT